MKLIDVKTLELLYPLNFEKNLKGRRILFDDIDPLLQKLSTKFEKEILGYSENNIPIYKISAGTGKIKILVWSQMHGNESTGTKALFDLFNFLEKDNAELSEIIKTILTNCTIQFIPMLNPDG
ncbi:MAG: M14 family zinc carboxypeptidase, partial [Lutibacter sp.]|nr:M14 family zinc carboxypeptidase [Lutibacter sp.]